MVCGSGVLVYRLESEPPSRVTIRLNWSHFSSSLFWSSKIFFKGVGEGSVTSSIHYPLTFYMFHILLSFYIQGDRGGEGADVGSAQCPLKQLKARNWIKEVRGLYETRG